MVLVSEIADVIGLLADVVQDTREIVDAVNDGRKFLASRHPQAQQDFIDLLGEMEITIVGLADVTKVLSGFRFRMTEQVVDYDTANQDLAELNVTAHLPRAE